jgi:hypothetical protein
MAWQAAAAKHYGFQTIVVIRVKMEKRDLAVGESRQMENP